MCIICVSPSGVKQPNVNTLRTMFYRNPHGAGYMFARDGKVTIHKGFMYFDDFLRAVRSERFTAADSVVIPFPGARTCGKSVLKASVPRFTVWTGASILCPTTV